MMMAKPRTSSAVEKEILGILGSGFKAPKSMDDQKYRAAMVKAVNELEDADWQSLSDDAQAWVNDGVKAIKGKKDIPDFPGASAGGEVEEAPKTKKGKKTSKKAAVTEPEEAEEAETEEAEEAETEEVEEAPKTKKGKKTSKKAAAPKAPKKEKAPKKAKEKGPTATFTELILQNPGKTRAEYVEALEKKGMTIAPGAAQINYYMTKRILKILAEKGKLVDGYFKA
jgi:hypothetical protein